MGRVEGIVKSKLALVYGVGWKGWREGEGLLVGYLFVTEVDVETVVNQVGR